MNSSRFENGEISEMWEQFDILELIANSEPLPGSQPAQDAAVLLPEPTGDYGIGTVTYHWVDENRDDRELMVRIWYPATVEEGMTPVPYIPDGETVWDIFEYHLRGLGTDYSPMREAVLAAQSHAYADAAIIEREAPYPIVIYIHPAISVPEMYTSQIEDMVSHGYIVVTPYYTNVAAAVVLPDERVVQYTTQQTALITDDTHFVLDHLEQINADDPLGIFTDRIALQQIGAFGIMQGGRVAFSTASEDSRIKAVIVDRRVCENRILDQGLEQPFMYLEQTGIPTNSPRCYENDHYFENFSGPVYRLLLVGFGGFDPSDGLIWTWPDNTRPGVAAALNYPPLSTNDGDKALEGVNAYIRAFFDQHLKGEEVRLLEGRSFEWREVRIIAPDSE